MTADPYDTLCTVLVERPRRWLVTGGAGFVGSHILQELLQLEQQVVVLDHMADPARANLDAVREIVGDELWQLARVIEGDIRDRDVCAEAVRDVDLVLHQAAISSVPRSMDRPEETHDVNVDGFANIAVACTRAGVRALVYASSAAVYGDEPTLPKAEQRLGRPAVALCSEQAE